MRKTWNFMIDQGGTFTDIIAVSPDDKIKTYKLLSKKDQKEYNPILEGISNIIKNSKSYFDYPIDNIKIGTTIGTNALLERKGFKVLLLVTKGFKDNFIIGSQQRSEIFKRHHIRKEKIYNSVLEIEERISINGKILTHLNKSKIYKKLEFFYKNGINSISIVLLNSFKFPKHEIIIKDIAKQIGFENISCSYEVCPTINFTSRGYTTLVDAYLNPIIKKYIENIETKLKAKKVLYMQSNGFLTIKKNFNGRSAVLSGPAGGVNGGIKIAKENNIKRIIGFDMGGTSADIWQYNGEIQKNIETKISEVLIKTPSLKIDSIASGGGSIVNYLDNRLTVGPQSAGAFPGPASYRNNGPLTLTDCNLILGKIMVEEFPKLFGKKKNLPISKKIAEGKFKIILKKINKDFVDFKNIFQVADSFINIAVENMSNAIKKITIQKGFDIRNYTLLVFGSASGQYCCKIAEKIGVKKIIFSPFSSMLSAYGVGVSKIGNTYQLSIEKTLNEKQIKNSIASISNKFIKKNKLSKCNYILRIKYFKCNTIISIKLNKKKASNIKNEFFNKHRKLFGFNYKNRKIIIDSIEAEVYQNSSIKKTKEDYKTYYNNNKVISTKFYSQGKWVKIKKINKNFFNNYKAIKGPAIFSDFNTSITIEKGWEMRKLLTGSFLIVQKKKRVLKTTNFSSKKPNPEMLEIFNNLFYSIAEQMGIVLKNTAQSINVKERLDFSCALFNGNGDLIANAPHIPIHLGAMSDTVKYLIKKFEAKFKKGISLLHNNPFSGGTHLPDLTVITPYLNNKKNKVLYYLANRAHHSDIGGITPGSMPAFSKSIKEEGIVFDGLEILKNGEIKEKNILYSLKKNSFPSRDPYQNLYDIRAQLAANQKGIIEVNRVIKTYGNKTVKNYVSHIQKNCSNIIYNVIKKIRNSSFKIKMDNESLLKTNIKFHKKTKKLIINFEGTSPQSNDNFNAPIAVTKSVIIYFLRTLVSNDIPLNEGFLKNVQIIIPEKSLLSPEYPAPVVAGNVETSQTLIDLLNASISIQSACYGTMSNISFGNKYFGYYETICGGEGASFENNGTDAVHCHMTNTSITDPEILEFYYPVRLINFSIRKDSGGKGKWFGGNGVVREIQFLQKLEVSILSNRRKVKPFGINKGESGKNGENYIIKKNKNISKLGYVSHIKVNNGDTLVIKTPGGGGYG